MNKIKSLEQLKHAVEQLNQEKNRAEGRLEEAQKRIKEEFKVNTLAAAKKLLKKLETEEETARKEFEGELEAFNEEWADKLEE